MLNGTHKNGNGSSNGVHEDTAILSEHDLFWDGLPPAVTRALAQPLDSALVSQRRGREGRTYSYIEGHTVIDQANRVFGYGGWGYGLVGDVTLRRIETGRYEDRRGEGHPRLQRPGEGHRPRRGPSLCRCPARSCRPTGPRCRGWSGTAPSAHGQGRARAPPWRSG